jgi:hypothetical protein
VPLVQALQVLTSVEEAGLEQLAQGALDADSYEINNVQSIASHS